MRPMAYLLMRSVGCKPSSPFLHSGDKRNGCCAMSSPSASVRRPLPERASETAPGQATNQATKNPKQPITPTSRRPSEGRSGCCVWCLDALSPTRDYHRCCHCCCCCCCCYHAPLPYDCSRSCRLDHPPHTTLDETDTKHGHRGSCRCKTAKGRAILN